MTMTKTKTKTFGEDPERATQETCDHWDIWSEWWGDMTWPTKKQLQRQRQWQRQRHCDLWDTDYISDNWEQQSQHSELPLNKEWQGQHSQFLRCFYLTHLFETELCDSRLCGYFRLGSCGVHLLSQWITFTSVNFEQSLTISLRSVRPKLGMPKWAIGLKVVQSTKKRCLTMFLTDI